MPVSSHYQFRRRFGISSLLLLFSLLCIMASPAQRAFAAPVINSINPTTASAGETITINGSGLLGPANTTSTVFITFNGTSDPIQASPEAGATSSLVTVKVPAHARSGALKYDLHTTDNTTGDMQTQSATSPTLVIKAIITHMDPATGSEEAPDFIYVYGSGFSNTTGLLFGTVAATNISVTETFVGAFVPPGAVTAPISVVTSDAGTATSPTNFTVTGNIRPSISTAAVHTTAMSTPKTVDVTVGDANTAVSSLTLSATSSNLYLLANEDIVFGDSGANRTLTLTPRTKSFGESTITVTVNDGTGASNAKASVTFLLVVTPNNTGPISIGGFSPASGRQGDNVSITGTGLLGTATTTIWFRAHVSVYPDRWVPVAPAAGATSTSLTATVPLGARTGKLVVTADFADGSRNVAVSNSNYTVNSAISGFTPTQGQFGKRVTVEGSGFASTTGVTFNGVPGTIIQQGESSVDVLVPQGATTGAIAVITSDAGTATSATNFTVLPNTAPTITAITDKTTAEDIPTSAIPFTVGDAGTAPENLTVSGSSNNLALVPIANIVFDGGGANRTVTVSPAPDKFGTALITITVSDGDATASSAFTLVVEEDNDIPTVTPIADQIINEDTSTTDLAFTVADTETPATQLTVSGSSENPALVPNENIVISGTGANRTVKVTPVPNGYGTATIIIIASDGFAEGSTNFELGVTNINDAPTLTAIATQTVDEDTSTAALPFTVADSDSPLNEVTVTGTSSNTLLVPNANITFTGTGASRTVKVTPAANLSGSATITLTASDGGLSSTRTFAVNVTAVNDAPTISDIANRSTPKGTSTEAISFTISDIETAHGSLTVSATSSNTALVPNANIVFGGSGASRTVTVTPVAGQTGTTTITVTVSDGSLTGSETFVLTVVTDTTAPAVTVTVPANGAFIQ